MKKRSRYTNIHQFISAPLIALAQAEMRLAMAEVDFIRRFGFTGGRNKHDDFGDLKKITFYYRKPGTGQIVEVSIPLLTLIPIPLLQIQSAEFSFDISIINEKTLDQSEDRVYESSINPPKEVDEFSAAISHSRDVTKSMSMTINAAQSDLPAGLAHLLNLLDEKTETIIIGNLELELKVHELIVEEQGTKDIELDITAIVTNPDGSPHRNVPITSENVSVLLGSEKITTDMRFVGGKSKSSKEGRVRFIVFIPLDLVLREKPPFIFIKVTVVADGNVLSNATEIPIVY